MTSFKIAVKLTLLVLVLAYPPHTAAAGPLLSPDLQAQTVFSKTYTTTGANSTVYGNVLAGGVSTIGASGLVSGDLVSGGAANLGGLSTSARNATVTGSISSGGVLTTGDHAVVGANITSSGASTVGANSQIGGNMVSDGAATTGASSIVRGNIETGGAASIGATATVVGEVAAVGAITVPPSSTIGSQRMRSSSPIDPTTYTAGINSRVSSGASSVATAQNALMRMGTGTALAATITTDRTLFSGVYSAASLSTTAGTPLYLDGQNLDNQYWSFNIADILATGASTDIVLINAGFNSGVIWNIGGYASLGASSTFIGTILAEKYISVGANAKVFGVENSCGGLYSATSYVSTGDTAIVGGSGCTNTGGSFKVDPTGMAYYDSIAFAPMDIAEPASWMMMITGLFFTGMVMLCRTRRGSDAA